MSRVFETIIDLIQWIKIVLSPLLISGLIGVLVYLSNPNSTGIFLFALIVFVGLIIGIIWATRVWKKHGTNNYMSRVMASPDLDGKEVNSDSQKNKSKES